MFFGNDTGPKCQWSTQQASLIYQMHGISLLSTPGQLGPLLFGK